MLRITRVTNAIFPRCRTLQFAHFRFSTTMSYFPATSMPDKDWWSALWPSPAKVLLSLGLTKDMHVLDVCSGNGFFTIPMAKLVEHVSAVELDEGLMAEARRGCQGCRGL